MALEILTTSTFKSKTNVLGLTHVLIQEFLEIGNYKVKNPSYATFYDVYRQMVINEKIFESTQSETWVNIENDL